MKKGREVDKFRFSVSGTPTPTISEKLVKSLGKFFDCSIRDMASIKLLGGWLNDIDKTGLRGKFKAWTCRHRILPRILWPLLLYEFPISTISDQERRISRYLRRWLSLPRSLSSIALYGNTDTPPEIYRGTQVPQHITKHTLRPDIILVSETTKNAEAHCVMRRMDGGGLSAEEGEIPGPCQRLPQTTCRGCRGFGGQSFCRAYTALGITDEIRRRAIGNNTEATEKASLWFWMKRAYPWECAARAQVEA